MEWDIILSILDPKLLIIIVACYVLGLFLKASALKDELIPIVILVFAIIMTMAYLAIVIGEPDLMKVIVLGILQGLSCAAMAVFGHQFWKQLQK